MATYNGTSGDDIINATAGSNQINAGEGNNRVTAVTTGSNTVNAGNGNDTITTGSGDDYINAGGGNNVIDAGAGNNQVNSGSGNDTITTGAGNDTINAGDGRNIIDAGGGNNNITSGSGDDDIRTGAGNDQINAGNGNNLILAGEGQNNITAGSGDDTITTGSGNDQISAGDGRNTIDAGGGNNNISSGRGDDTITSGSGNDQINAGDGNNVINAGAGNNQVNTGSGNDTITTGDDNDQINAGDGINLINAGGGNNNVNTGRGDDTITTGDGNDQINAGDGANVINAGGGNNNVNTGNGADRITSGSGHDNINAGEGNNVIDAGAGNNNVTAGSGNDQITTGSGNDNIYAGEGTNVIKAGDGQNNVYTGSGADQITTGSGNDGIWAGEGNNVVDAGDGTNLVYTGSGNDIITTGDGNDGIWAGEGNNVIDAGDGINLIYTGSGNDRITTGSGNDAVWSGEGNDIVNLGGGSDTIFMGGGNDVIRHVVAENVGAHDDYWAEGGNDTLQLVLTAAEAANSAIIADINRFKAYLASGQNWTFQFSAFDLTARQFENLEIVAPVKANADSATVTEDNSVNIAVLANDVDILAANNSALNVISYNAAGVPGTLTLNNNVFTYTPGAAYQSLGAGQSATVSFTYTMGDNQGYTDTATVTLTITGTNDAPVAVADVAAITENQTLAIDVLANDTDVDANHVFTLLSGTAPTGKGTTSIVNNKLVFNPGTAFDHLKAGATEVVTLSYTMKDDQGAQSTSTVAVTVTGTNDAPIAVADTAAGTENQTLTINVLANDTDVDDGSVFTLLSASAPTGKGTTSVVGNQLVFNPGAAFDHLAVGATEVVTLSYVMKDDQGAQSTSTVTVTITGTNDAPIAVADTAAGTENQTLTINVLANDTDVDDGAVFTLLSASAPAGKGSTSVVGNQLVFNPGTAFDHLAAGATEVVTLSYVMKDAQGAQSTSTVTVTVTGTNDAPVAQAASAIATEDAAAVTGSLVATDVDDGATLSFALNAPIAGLTLGTNGVYSFNPGNAAYQALAQGEVLVISAPYTVTDNNGATSTAVLTITITGTNDAPVAIAAVGAATEDGATLSGQLASTDVDHGATASYTLDAPVAGLTLGTDGAYSFNPSNAAYQALAAGEIQTVVAAYTVTDDKGATSTSTLTITVTGTNDAPVAIAATAAQIEDAAAITGTLTSTDVDHGATASYALNAPVTGLTLASNGSYSFVATDPSYQALAAGETQTVVAAYTVTDDQGATSTSTLTITVTGTNDAPVAVAATASQTEDAAAITGQLSSTDVDHGATASYALNAPVAGLTINSNGSYSFVATAAAYQSLALGETLVVTAPYTVTDDKGATATSTLTITVTGTNDAPVAVADTASTVEDQPVLTGSVATNDSDVDHGAVLSYALNAPVAGLTINANGSYSFDPANAAYQVLARGEVQTIVAGYTVTDEHGATSTSTLTITITGTNDAPVALVDVTSAVEDGALVTGSVATNDYDVDHGATLSFALPAPVAGLTLAPDGSYSFDPSNTAYQALALGEVQTVVATYAVTDNEGVTAYSALVIIVTGTNDAPVAVADVASAIEDGAIISGSVATNDYDVDHGATRSFTLNAPVAGLTFNAAGAYSFDPSNAAYQSLAAGETLAVVASYTVTDQFGATGTATLTITVTGTNDAPVAIAATAAEIEDAAAITGQLSSTDVDHGATAAYTLDAPVTGLTLNADGSYSFVATAPAYQALALGETLVVTAPYTVTDDQGATSGAVLTITVTGTNDAPVAVADAATATEDGATLTGTVATNDSDVDHGATASFALNATVPGLTMAADGSYIFNPSNGAYQYLALGETTDVVVPYTITDEHGATAIATLTITVTGTNDAPVAIAATAAQTEDAAAITGQLSSTDVDTGATASFTLDAPVEGLVLNSDGTYSFVATAAAYQALAAGETLVVTAAYTVTDDHGATSGSTLTITVTGTNDAPVAVAATAAQTEDAAAITGQLASTDVDHGATATFALNAPVAGLTINSNGSYSFVATDPAYQALAAGETADVVANYTVTDDKGATSTSTLTITVTGTNDAPVVTSSAAAASGSVVEAGSTVSGTPTATGTLTSSDVDHNATATWSGAAAGTYGSFAINAAGVWSYTLDNSLAATDGLAAGQIVHETFNATVTDEHGATAVQQISITITGSEDNRSPTVENVTLTGQSGGSTGHSEGVAIVPYNSSTGIVFTHLVDTNGDGVADTPDAPSTIYGGSGQGLATGDLDGDGDIDIVSIDGYTVHSYTNMGDTDGDGRDNFVETSVYSGINSGDIALVDLNGDGKLDIVGSYNGQLFELLGNGADTNGNGLADDFTVRTVSNNTGGGYSYGITAGDIDGDGKADVVIGHYYGSGYAFDINFNRGDTDGDGQINYVTQGVYGLTSAGMGVTVADIDGDGRNDIIVGRWDNGGTDIYYNKGDTDGDGQINFVSSNLGFNDYVMETTVADIDGDGDLDIMSSSSNGQVTVSLNQGDTDGDGQLNFNNMRFGVGYSTYGLAVVDLDGDGDLDVLAPSVNGYYYGYQTAYLNNLGDTNGDGVVDFQIVQTSGIPSGWDAEPLVTGTGTGGSGVREDGPIVTGTFVGADADAGETATLTYQIVTQPSEGTVVNNGNGTFGFNPGAAFQDLAQGETREVTFTYQAVDSHGAASAPGTVTVTVAGANDAPVVSATSVIAGSVTEAGAATAGAATATGTLVSTDVDHGATATWSTSTTGGNYGSFAVNAAGQWTYTLDNSRGSTQSLAAGQTVTETFTARVTDDKGASATQAITVTIHGSNDAPVVYGAATGGVYEDNSATIYALNNVSDVDNGTTLSVTGVPGTLPAGVTYNASGQYFTLDASNAAYQSLAQGSATTVSVSYTVTDGTETVAQTASWTVYGTNDAPVITTAAGQAQGSVSEAGLAADGSAFAGVPSAAGTLSSTDVDTGATANWSGTTNGTYGNFAIDASGHWTYALDNSRAATQGLAAGQTVTENFTAYVSDGQGGNASQTVTLTVSGTNDAPVAAADVAGGASSGGAIRVGSTIAANSTTSSSQYQPTTTALSSGGFVTAWVDNSSGGSKITAQLFDSTGAKVGGEFSTSSTSTYSPQVAALANGGFVLTFTTQGNYNYGTYDYENVRAQMYDAQGHSVGTEIAVNSVVIGSQYQPVVTGLASGGFIVVWTDNSSVYNNYYYGIGSNDGGEIKAQIYGANGAPVGTEFLVNTTHYSEQSEATVTVLASGNIVVAWTDSSQQGGDTSSAGITAQLLSASGAKIGGEFTLNTITQDYQSASAITALASGGFVATWRTPGTGNSGNGNDYDNVHGQVFDAQGNKIGGEISVNTTLTGSQYQPAVSALPDGGFVVVWQDDHNYYDGNSSYGNDVKAQLFAADGTKVGGEFVVSSATDGEQQDATITTLASGDIVVAWSDYSPQNGYDQNINAQIFSFAKYGENDTITYNVLANDTDPDNGAVLTITSVSAPAGKGTASIVNNKVVFDPGTAFDHLAKGATEVVVLPYTISDDHGVTSSSTLTITITGTNDAPVVSGAVTAAVAEDGAVSTLNALTNVSDVDDGAVLTIGNVGALPAGVTYNATAKTFSLNPSNAAYQALAAGETRTVSVAYTVSDGIASVSQSVSWTITGTNDAPTVSAIVTGTATEDGAVSTLNALTNASDIDAGTVLTVANVGTLPAGVTYNATAKTFSLDPSNAAYNYLAAGQTALVTVTYDVSDGTASVAQTMRWTITGTNDAPVVSGAVTGTAIEDGATVTLNALANATDEAGSTLSVVSIGTLPSGVTYNATTKAFTLDPANAAYQALAAGQTTVVTVNYSVSDGSLSTPTSASWTVTGSNDAPTVSGAVTGTATEDGASVTLNALTNASDVDSGTALSVTNVGTLPAGVTFNAGTNSFTLDPSNAAYQSLAAGATTVVTVSYQVSDGTASVAQTASWTVTGTNDAPAVSGSVTGSAIEDGAVSTLNALTNASDVDAGTVLSVTNVPGTLPAGVTYNATAKTFSLDPSNAAYQPLAAGETTTVTVSYQVSDGTASVAQTAVWTITGTNDAPTVSAIVTATATEDGSAVTVNALTNAADVDHGATLSITNVGTLPAGVTYDATAKTFTLDPTNAAYQALAQGGSQLVSVTYTVSDGTASVAQTARWTVFGTNDAPVITSNAAAATGTVVEAGNLANGTVVAGTPTATGTLTASDVDTGSTRSWSLNGGSSTYGTLAITTAGVWTYTLDNTRAATQALTAGQAATDTFTVRVTDNNGAFVNQTVTVNVTGTNDKPVLSVPLVDPAAVHPGDAFAYTVPVGSFTDVDGAVTYSATLSDGSALPSWLSFNAATRTFSGTPAAGDMATLNVNVTATDGSGATATDTVAFAVTPHFSGTADGDTLTGTSASEVMVGLGGNDTIVGGGGNDIIYGGAYGEQGQSGTASSLTALAQSYYTHNNTLVTGLGTAAINPTATFGENYLAKNDDLSTPAIDITSVFGASGLNFFGTNYTSLFINNNGNITFGSAYASFNPLPIAPTGLPPIIAAFWADVDTRGNTSVSTGGTSKGTDLLYYDLDTVNHVLTVTWDDVGAYSTGSVPNAFQLQLIDRGSGNFDIIYRYEIVQWGLGSANTATEYARVGFSSGAGTAYELAGSGTNAVLNYDTITGNTGIVGVQVFEVRNGVVSVSENDILDGGAGADTLIGGSGNDTFIFRPGEANGDHVVDFNGLGTAAGDALQFIGYGAGATFSQIDTTHWQVNYGAGLTQHDVITFDNAPSINVADYTFI